MPFSAKMKSTYRNTNSKINICNINIKKGGQVGVTLLYSRLQVGHFNGWC